MRRFKLASFSLVAVLLATMKTYSIEGQILPKEGYNSAVETRAHALLNVEPKLVYGPILTGEPTINTNTWVKDITRFIEFFFDPSEDRAKVIRGINLVNTKGNLFATNSLLDLTDNTFSLKLSKASRDVLTGAEVGSVGFPTGDQVVAMTLIAKSFSDAWKLNLDKLKELFPMVKFGNMNNIKDLIQRDGQLPNNLLVTPGGNFNIQFILFPFIK